MKKYLILSSFLLIISSLSIIGYIVVDAKQEITLETNLLMEQKENELYLTPYGYTMEDANIILIDLNTFYHYQLIRLFLTFQDAF